MAAHSIHRTCKQSTKQELQETHYCETQLGHIQFKVYVIEFDTAHSNHDQYRSYFDTLERISPQNAMMDRNTH